MSFLWPVPVCNGIFINSNIFVRLQQLKFSVLINCQLLISKVFGQDITQLLTNNLNCKLEFELGKKNFLHGKVPAVGYFTEHFFRRIICLCKCGGKPHNMRICNLNSQSLAVNLQNSVIQLGHSTNTGKKCKQFPTDI